MRTNLCLIALFISLFCQASSIAGDKDKRLTAISASQLQQAISQTPLNSPLQQELMSRARHAHLMGVAYIQYSALWRQQPNNAYANLLRGVSAEYLEWDSMYPELRPLYKSYTQDSLLPVAASCLKKAAKLAPNSCVANTEAGFFFWQFGNDLPEGLSLLRKAIKLAPNDAQVHVMWSLVYSNPTTNSYDSQKALEQLALAARLDPTYAFPHKLMADLYNRLKQPVKAEQERSRYQSLIP